MKKIVWIMVIVIRTEKTLKKVNFVISIELPQHFKVQSEMIMKMKRLMMLDIKKLSNYYSLKLKPTLTSVYTFIVN